MCWEVAWALGILKLPKRRSYSNREVLLSSREKHTINTCHNMDEPPKHCAKRRKQRHMLYNLIYMKFLEKAKL